MSRWQCKKKYLFLFLKEADERKKMVGDSIAFLLSVIQKIFIYSLSGACCCTNDKQTVFIITTHAVVTTPRLQDLLQEMSNSFCMVRSQHKIPIQAVKLILLETSSVVVSMKDYWDFCISSCIGSQLLWVTVQLPWENQNVQSSTNS